MKYRLILSAFLFLAPLFTANLAKAEYRVFLLKITKKNVDPAFAADFRLVESTLDDMQYRQFYHVAPDEEVTYIDTWRCYGRTGDFKPLCPNPKGQIAEPQSPAS